ncbi:MAG TPA: glutathione transferase GstA [Alphaproteobacteria bacterium]|nr:glutathione transferase GstA [Alphaproteobacteria bacterium]
MKLYYTPGACSLSPHIVLREAGVPITLERVDLATKKTESGADFTAINPKGQVPALQLDTGDILTEGAVIVQYIADRKPESGLVPPAGSIERYRVQEWLNYIACEVHKTFAPLFNPKTPEASRQINKERLASQFGYLDRHLAKNQHLAGSKFTAADAYAFTVISWSRLPMVAIDLSRWPNLSAFMGKIAARPKVEEAMKAEGLKA